jgi:cytochrome c oxidase subunit IV
MNHATHQVVPRRTYYLVFFALLVLTATTVGLDYVELGKLNLVIALLIAATKATLVVWFFMQVRVSSALTKIFVVSGLLWMLLLISLTLTDYISRGWLYVPRAWSDTAKKNVLE